MAINTWAITKKYPEIKQVGLCHSVQHTVNELASDLKIPVSKIRYLLAGINHVSYFLKFEELLDNGVYKDLYPALKKGYEDGFFVGAHLFDRVTPEMDIYKKEIFGPVLSTVRAGSYEEAIGLAMNHEYGNGTAIFTRDGDTARDFSNRINIGMVGVNVPIPVPLAYHTFGGWKKSVFGDLNQHGPDAFKFYTRTKTVTSRWPSGIKEGGEFNFKAMD